MRLGTRGSFGLLGLLVALRGLVACSGDGAPVNPNDGSSQGTGGVVGTGGGVGSGGAGSGGFTGAPSGGMGGSGGTSSGGASTGGASTGGASTGGASTGGASTGGASTGGARGVGSGGSAGIRGGGSGGSASGSAGRGGSGSGSGGAAGSSAAFLQVSAVLGKNCGISGCHADKQTPHFAPGATLYTTLTSDDTVLAECNYTKLIEPGDPAQSALVRLMNRKCGNFVMPPTCRTTPCISAADLKVLTDWIQAGAPP